jgi:uncharacterized protein YjbK
MIPDARSEKTRKSTSINEIDAQIARLKEKRKQLQIRQTERITKAVLKAAEESGLLSLEIPEQDLKVAFGEIVRRFRPAESNQTTGSVKPDETSPNLDSPAD